MRATRMEFAPPSSVTVGRRRLAYEEVSPPQPEGTILLLCGIGSKRQGWYRQLPALGQRFRARRVTSAVSAPGFAERHPEAIDEFVEIALHNPMTRAAYLRQLEACRAHDVAGRLHEIRAPTLVLHGAADPLVRIENGRLLADRIPGAALIVYENVGHIPEVECDVEFNRDLLAFLG